MNTLCVCYDLNKPGQDYTELCQAIKAYGIYWHYLDSTWFIVTSKTPEQVRDQLAGLIDSGDELLVFNVGTLWAGHGFKKQAYEWLMAHWYSA